MGDDSGNDSEGSDAAFCTGERENEGGDGSKEEEEEGGGIDDRKDAPNENDVEPEPEG